MKKVMTACLFSLLITPVMAEDEVPFEAQIKARQAHMSLYGFNIGILGAMARGNMPYEAEMAQIAANNLKLANQMDNRAMWPPGSDASAPGLAGVTRAKAEAWAEGSDIGEKAQAMTTAITDMAANAGNGLDAVRANMRALGGACQGCHEGYRVPED
ncbi:MAG: cytochrome c [Pseudomonadota bacterium]